MKSIILHCWINSQKTVFVFANQLSIELFLQENAACGSGQVQKRTKCFCVSKIHAMRAVFQTRSLLKRKTLGATTRWSPILGTLLTRCARFSLARSRAHTHERGRNGAELVHLARGSNRATASPSTALRARHHCTAYALMQMAPQVGAAELMLAR